MANQLDIDKVLSDLDIENVNSVEDCSTELSIPDNTEVSVNPDVIYSRLNKLIETGDNLLQTTQYLIQSAPDADNISSAASLISSIRDVVHEFTVIHRDKLKFDQQLQLEQYKATQKEKLLKMRLENNQSTSSDTTNSVDMLEYSQESIVAEILKSESHK